MSSRRSRSKREVITIDDDDDSASSISPDVFELQKKIAELEQKNAKLERTSQGACRIAGEAQARVQFLENLLDTKPQVVDIVKNKEREDELEKKIDQQSPEFLELQKKVAELEQKNAKLEKTSQGACRVASEAQARVQFLENLLDNKPELLDYAKTKQRENELEKTIADLKAKFAQFKGLPQTPTVQKPSLSLEEYRKRKLPGFCVGGKKKESQRSGGPTKKSFMPSGDASASSSVRHVNLPGLDDPFRLDELTRRVYGETPKRGGTSSLNDSLIGKSGPTPKRLSINDRLKHEFSLPILKGTTQSPAAAAANVLSIGGQLTAIGGRALIESPHPTSLIPPSTSSRAPSSTSAAPSTSASSFFKRTLSDRSTK